MRVVRTLLLVAAAVALAVVAGAPALFYAGPALLVAALLANGRFLGEERVHAWRVARQALVTRRRAGTRAQRWSMVLPGRPVSVFARTPPGLRGPPALVRA